MSPSVAPVRRSSSIDGRDDEQRLTADIIELAPAISRYDAELLRQAGWIINDKRVERIWQREGLIP